MNAKLLYSEAGIEFQYLPKSQNLIMLNKDKKHCK
jgi:hypothetical protein